MTRMVVDASAMAAVIFKEPGFEQILERLTAGAVSAPPLLEFELINIAWKKVRRHPSHAAAILTALGLGLSGQWDIEWHDVEPVDVALVAAATGTSGYDASYLWLAGALGADLVTLDSRLARFQGAI